MSSPSERRQREREAAPARVPASHAMPLPFHANDELRSAASAKRVGGGGGGGGGEAISRKVMHNSQVQAGGRAGKRVGD